MSDVEETKGTHDDAVDTNEQPFLEHIIELRARILRGLIAVLVLFFPTYYFANQLYAFIALPLQRVLPEGSSMIATGVATPFITPFKLAIYAALFLGVPIWLHQVWAFISPGLYRHEKKFAIPLLISSVVLFYCGMAFVYYLVFPIIFPFFVGISPADTQVMTDISQYLEFVLKMFFAFGVAFEIPIATMLIAWSGIASAETMATKRPYVIIGCFVIGMLLTPPDVVSQLLLALPCWLLFEIGIFFARFIEAREGKTPDDSDPDV